MTTSIQATVLKQTARQRELAQGQARPSRVRFLVLVTGVGETRLEDKQGINFGCFMLEEPTFSPGAAALGSIPKGALPLYSATVTSYKLNSMGLYVGANIGFKVESADPSIRLKFSLTFEGVAMRTTAGITP